MSKQTRLSLAALMVVVGGLWCAQGLGWLSGSDMSGHPLWAVVGLAVALGGVVVAVRVGRGVGKGPAWATDPARDHDPAPGEWSATQSEDTPGGPAGGPETREAS